MVKWSSERHWVTKPLGHWVTTLQMKRRIIFAAVALAALALIALGIKLGDLETIHRFSAQI